MHVMFFFCLPEAILDFLLMKRSCTFLSYAASSKKKCDSCVNTMINWTFVCFFIVSFRKMKGDNTREGGGGGGSGRSVFRVLTYGLIRAKNCSTPWFLSLHSCVHVECSNSKLSECFLISLSLLLCTGITCQICDRTLNVPHTRFLQHCTKASVPQTMVQALASVGGPLQCVHEPLKDATKRRRLLRMMKRTTAVVRQAMLTQADDEGAASAHNAEGTDAIGVRYSWTMHRLPCSDCVALDMSSKRAAARVQGALFFAVSCCGSTTFSPPSFDLPHPLWCGQAQRGTHVVSPSNTTMTWFGASKASAQDQLKHATAVLILAVRGPTSRLRSPKHQM